MSYYSATQRFKAGHHTETDLLADDASIVRDWTGEAHGIKWLVATANLVKNGAARFRGGDGHLSSVGFRVVSAWTFDVLTDAMFEYLKDTIFGGAESIDATIHTYNQAEREWQTYQCIATFTELTEDEVSPFGNRGFTGVRITFSRCVLNTD